MGVVTALGSARKGLALAARTVADAVDRELVNGTSEQERRAAKALQRDTERAIARKALTYEKSKRTDLSFVEETNKKAVERQATRSELVLGPVFDSRRETFERDDGTTIAVADRTTRSRPNVWAPAYDADGRRVKPPSRGPKFDPPSRARACVVDVLAARDLDARRAYVTLDLVGERVGATRAATGNAPRAPMRTKNGPSVSHRFDASFQFAAAKRLSDDEALVLTVRRVRDDAVLGAVTVPIDAVEDADDPSARDAKKDASTSRVEAFWTRLADPPCAPAPDLGALRVACFVDAEAPGRIRVFVARARRAGSGSEEDEEEDDVAKTKTKTKTPSSRLGPAAYVRVSLNRVDPRGSLPKKDDRRRTKATRPRADGVTRVFDEAFAYENVDPEGDSTVSFELFRENALGGADEAVARLALPVKALPRARDGDAAARPRDRAWRLHSRSKRHARDGASGGAAAGEVCVAACFLDAKKSRLRVRVLEARDVRAGDETGTSDAYVRATLLENGRKAKDAQVFRTKVVYGTTSPAWRHEFYFRVASSVDGSLPGSGSSCFAPETRASRARVDGDGEPAARARVTDTAETDVRGLAVALDLFDHDFGDFDADDFLGRVVLPLDAVATAGATSADAEKRSEWYPWRDLARANPIAGEVLIRAHFPSDRAEVDRARPSPRDVANATGTEPDPLDPSVSRVAAALFRRLAARDASEARRKAKRLELEKHGLRRELEAQLRVQLEAHDWPADLAARYARAYAKHAHESHRIPPPPLGLAVPAAFAHMFETAERAAGVVRRARQEGTEGDEAFGGEKRRIDAIDTPESAEEPSFSNSAAPPMASPPTGGAAPSAPYWSIAAGGAASAYFRQSPTRAMRGLRVDDGDVSRA